MFQTAEENHISVGIATETYLHVMLTPFHVYHQEYMPNVKL